jgi:hypothetical protein
MHGRPRCWCGDGCGFFVCSQIGLTRESLQRRAPVGFESPIEFRQKGSPALSLSAMRLARVSSQDNGKAATNSLLTQVGRAWPKTLPNIIRFLDRLLFFLKFSESWRRKCRPSRPSSHISARHRQAIVPSQFGVVNPLGHRQTLAFDDCISFRITLENERIAAAVWRRCGYSPGFTSCTEMVLVMPAERPGFLI